MSILRKGTINIANGLSKNGESGLTSIKLEHALLLILGIALVAFADVEYPALHPVSQILILIIYLTFLVGVAPLPMPVMKSKFWQVMGFGYVSGALDSFVVLDQARRMKTLEAGQSKDKILEMAGNQATEGVRAVFLALITVAALIGGLVLWPGELYAAAVYMFHERTTAFSGLYIIPPVTLFLSIVSWHASLLPITVIQQEGEKIKKRDLVEFTTGIVLLLYFHNPMLCLGLLIIYAGITFQGDHLFDVWKHHTETNVALVILISLVSGWWISEAIVEPLGLDTGFGAIVPSALQSVLWGTLYTDMETSFWWKITIISTGAMLTPISSLVGVMLFKTGAQWRTYMRISVPYAILWFCIMAGWIFITEGTMVETFLDQWAVATTPHH